MNPAVAKVENSSEELVRSFLAAMGRTDIHALSDLLAEDATWWLAGDLPVSGLYEGKTAVLGEFLSAAAGLFKQGSLAFELRNMVTNGGAVVAEYTGTGHGAAGRSYRNQYCTIFECRDGKISSVREYLDTAHVRDALYPAGGE